MDATQRELFGDTGTAVVDSPWIDTLGYQTEHALLFGLGPLDELVIRELVVWREEWARWRDVVMPKFAAAFPGYLPAAAFITGEAPMRPIDNPLPLASRLRGSRMVYVVDGSRGFTYADLPVPYQQPMPIWLWQCGVIGRDEYLRSRSWSRAAAKAAYSWEVARG